MEDKLLRMGESDKLYDTKKTFEVFISSGK